MPKFLEIAPKDRRRLQKLYCSGQSPVQIEMSLRGSKIALSARQISNLVVREGWTRLKSEIADMKAQTAKEVFESVRSEGIRELETVLRHIRDGTVTDAENLADSWSLVGDAADASALQRAKSLHFDRVLKFYRLDDRSEDGGRGNTLAVIFGNPIGYPTTEKSAVAVSTAAAIEHETKLDFGADDD